MNLREAAQQALEALELAGMSHDVMLMSDPPQDAWKARGVNWKLAEAMNALRAALADTQDWDEIEALRASLREHMAEIHRLRAAGRQALEALCLPCDRWNRRQTEIINASLATLRAALAEDAMQRLTDVQQEMESVTICHEKEGGKLAPPLKRGEECEYPWCLSPNGCERQCPAFPRCEDSDTGKKSDDPETNFGSMGQAVDSTRADHIADANKMVPTINEMETVEPVAYVTGYRDGFCVINPVEHVVFPTGMALYMSPPTCQESRQVEPVAWCIVENGRVKGLVKSKPAVMNADLWQPLYTAPPKPEPLTEEQILDLLPTKQNYWSESDTGLWIARAIERAHGIGGEE